MNREQLIERLHELMLPLAETDDAPVGEAELEQRYSRLKLLSATYIETLSLIPLSRCPFTDATHWQPIDVAGLDGPWWRYEAPLRPEITMPEHHLTFTGSLKLTPPLEYAPFVCMPGPEVPYVVPELLQHPGIKAVLNSVDVGMHEGHVVHYYAEELTEDLPGFNGWGADHYRLPGEDKEGYWRRIENEASEELDFDMGHWIKEGKLLWIEPGDNDLQLRNDLEACPYIDLPGQTTFQYIQYGEVSTSIPDAGDDDDAPDGTGSS